MPNLGKGVGAWRAAHPYAAAWLVSRTLWCFCLMAAIMHPAIIFGFLTGGLLREWALRHDVLVPVIAILVPVLVLDWAMKVLSPLVDCPAEWPLADQNVHYAVQSRLQAVAAWKLLLGMLAALIFSLALISLGHSGLGGNLSLGLMFGFALVFDLRPNGSQLVIAPSGL